MQFCTIYNFSIQNAKTKHREMSPDGKFKKQTDYIIYQLDQKSKIYFFQQISTDIRLDHSLLMTTSKVIKKVINICKMDDVDKLIDRFIANR